jgi:hypothetical protein
MSTQPSVPTSAGDGPLFNITNTYGSLMLGAIASVGWVTFHLITHGKKYEFHALIRWSGFWESWHFSAGYTTFTFQKTHGRSKLLWAVCKPVVFGASDEVISRSLSCGLLSFYVTVLRFMPYIIIRFLSGETSRLWQSQFGEDYKFAYQLHSSMHYYRSRDVSILFILELEWVCLKLHFHKYRLTFFWPYVLAMDLRPFSYSLCRHSCKALFMHAMHIASGLVLRFIYSLKKLSHSSACQWAIEMSGLSLLS